MYNKINIEGSEVQLQSLRKKTIGWNIAAEKKTVCNIKKKMIH